jgi:hypothetical protein
MEPFRAPEAAAVGTLGEMGNDVMGPGTETDEETTGLENVTEGDDFKMPLAPVVSDDGTDDACTAAEPGVLGNTPAAETAGASNGLNEWRRRGSKPAGRPKMSLLLWYRLNRERCSLRSSSSKANSRATRCVSKMDATSESPLARSRATALSVIR